MTQEQINNIIIFMQRTQLQGSEVSVFADCINALQSLLDKNKTE